MDKRNGGIECPIGEMVTLINTVVERMGELPLAGRSLEHSQELYLALARLTEVAVVLKSRMLPRFVPAIAPDDCNRPPGDR